LRNPKVQVEGAKVVEHRKYNGLKVSKCAIGVDQKCKKENNRFLKKKNINKIKEIFD
jgi:hypothetical protein